MLLNEFFGNFNLKSNNSDDNQDKSDDLFWYIVDHDKLHKDFFIPIARKLKNMKECGEGEIYELFMPMVNKGCKEYYAFKHLPGKLHKQFPKQVRETLCQRLYDHYHEDILKDTYKLD